MDQVIGDYGDFDKGTRRDILQTAQTNTAEAMNYINTDRSLVDKFITNERTEEQIFIDESKYIAYYPSTAQGASTVEFQIQNPQYQTLPEFIFRLKIAIAIPAVLTAGTYTLKMKPFWPLRLFSDILIKTGSNVDMTTKMGQRADLGLVAKLLATAGYELGVSKFPWLFGTSLDVATGALTTKDIVWAVGDAAIKNFEFFIPLKYFDCLGVFGLYKVWPPNVPVVIDFLPFQQTDYNNIFDLVASAGPAPAPVTAREQFLITILNTSQIEANLVSATNDLQVFKNSGLDFLTAVMERSSEGKLKVDPEKIRNRDSVYLANTLKDLNMTPAVQTNLMDIANTNTIVYDTWEWTLTRYQIPAGQNSWSVQLPAAVPRPKFLMIFIEAINDTTKNKTPVNTMASLIVNVNSVNLRNIRVDTKGSLYNTFDCIFPQGHDYPSFYGFNTFANFYQIIAQVTDIAGTTEFLTPAVSTTLAFDVGFSAALPTGATYNGYVVRVYDQRIMFDALNRSKRRTNVL